MRRFEIEINLEHIAAQRKAWNEAAREFNELVDRALTRLIYEAAAKRLSIPYVASKAGFTNNQIKSRMKAMGLNPTTGKTLLSKQAAAVLESNAEIMGIQPHEVDLMSPLAYLPAGPLLKHETSEVKELDEFGFPETPTSEQVENALKDAVFIEVPKEPCFEHERGEAGVPHTYLEGHHQILKVCYPKAPTETGEVAP